MWDLLKGLPHGRISLRSFSLLVTATLVTFFSIGTLLAPTAFAADNAVRSGDNIIYQDNTYTPASKDDIPSNTLHEFANTEGYRYTDEANSKAYFVFTSTAAASATSGYYVVYAFTPPADYGSSSNPVNVAITPSNTDDGATESPKEVSACDGATMGGTGYIVCPVVNFIANGMDTIYGIIAQFLEVKTVTGDTASPIYQLWKVVRDIANIAFVIAFLVIVYSQLTSIGISNYSIKSMVPRLIIAAILVNISFWLCAAAVDASNILGYSIHNLFQGLMDKFSVGANYNGVGDVPTWQQVAAVALASSGAAWAGTAVISYGIVGSIYLLIPFLVGAIIAALIALIILATRQALITIFVIIAPLAFVAYILPNTEKYFDKWREALTTLLVLFPVFSVVFSGAQLAGMAIIQTAGGNLVTIILGMAVQVAPLAITPLLIKFSGGIIGKVASITNNPNKGVMDRTRKWAQGAALESKNKILTDQSKLFGKNPLNKATKALDTRRRHVEGRRKAYEGMADNRFADTDQGRNLEAMNKHTTNEKQRIDNSFANSQQGRQLDLQSRHLGVEKQEIDNSVLRSDAGKQFTGRQHAADIDKTRVSNEFEESSIGKQIDTSKRVVDQEKKRIDNSHQASWDKSVRTDATLNHLELSVKSSELKAAAEKERLEKMHQEIAVKGDTTDHVLNLRGSNPTLQQGILNIARDINRNTVETSVTSMAKTAAQGEMSTQINEALSSNTMVIDGKTIRQYAAGIGSEAGVFATAIAKERKDFGEKVSYQKELAGHYKVNSAQIAKLAMGIEDAEIKDDAGNVIYTFDRNDEHIRDMATAEVFKVGSHNQKMAVIKSTAKGGINYDYRSTIQQAAIQSNISSIAPAIADATYEEIINGTFDGDASWQYHSFREVLEGRIKTNTLSTANAASLELLFNDIDSSPMARAQFNKLIDNKSTDELIKLQKKDPAATLADAKASLISQFDTKRKNMKNMSVEVLKNTTVRQNANDESVDALKKFAGNLYNGR